MAGTLSAGTLSDGSKSVPVADLIQGNPRAFVVMDTTTATPTIKSKMNISSITDLGVGVHTINFTKAMPSVNYYVLGGTLSDGNNSGGSLSLKVWGAYNVGPTTKTTGAVSVVMWSGNGAFDTKDTYVVIGGGA